MTTTTKPGPNGKGGGEVFQRAARDLKRLRYVAQDALRSTKDLERIAGDHLGVYEIGVGEGLDEQELLDFLRLALEGTSKRAISVHVVAHQS